MADVLDQLIRDARRWALRGQDQGWLDAERVAQLESVEIRSPGTLFDADLHRPLVVAFFGGTGVGKSTLLNRLAGEAIARTGVERPTSREVSVYLHESMRIRQMPAGFPLERVRCAHHRDEKRRQVLWIDMPDIDSTEVSNRDLVLDWLPHIDVLVYVVSPERYRDDKGWRMLQGHCAEHAWLFVMNQWDLGHPAQRQDFLKLLSQGGFPDPVILCTDCRNAAADDFTRLQEIIQSLADEHVVQQLEARAQQQRLEDLHRRIGECLQNLGDAKAYASLRAFWEHAFEDARGTLLSGLAWPLQQAARAFVRHEASPLLKRLKLDADSDTETQTHKPASPSLLWDDWAQMQLQDAIDRLLVEAGSLQVPRAPLRAALREPARKARARVLGDAQKSLRLALANPGNTLQRFLLKSTGLCAILLPLSAIGWVSYDVVTAYYQSALTHSGYLGADFAIHGGLLIAIAWLLPFALHRMLKPSAERTALKGLRQGVDGALAAIEVDVTSALDQVAADCQGFRAEGLALLETSPAAEPAVTAPAHTLLERMLPSRRAG